MRTIYKYKLTTDFFGNAQKITVPDVWSFHSCMEQDGEITLWIGVDTEATKSEMTFKVYGTGNEILGDCEFIGTVKIGAFIFHVHYEP